MAGSEQKDRIGTRGEIAAAVSETIVRLIRDYTGRGPTKARTTIVDDHVTVLMEDTLLKAEHTLIRHGRGDAVIEMRRQLQYAMRDELTEAVERHVGRKVVAYMSDNSIDPDIMVEVFALEPRSAGSATVAS